MEKVALELSLEQAYAVRDALDCYSRLCIGQIEEVGELIRSGTIPHAESSERPRYTASPDQIDHAMELLNQVKAVLGYPRNGSNGIGHSHVHASACRAYETKKVLAQALAYHREPTPSFKGVDYDGLGPRYTQDPAPIARVMSAGASGKGA